MSIALIEENVDTVVEARLAAIVADPTLLSDIFPAASNPLTEMTAWFTDLAAAPPLHLGFPRTTIKPPFFVQVLRSDNEAPEEAVGNYLGSDSGVPFVTYTGIVKDAVLEFWTVGESAVMTRWLHVVLEDALLRNRTALLSEANGLLLLHHYSGDLQPNEQLQPEFQFVRTVQVRCKHVDSLTETSSDGPIASLPVTSTWSV